MLLASRTVFVNGFIIKTSFCSTTGGGGGVNAVASFVCGCDDDNDDNDDDGDSDDGSDAERDGDGDGDGGGGRLPACTAFSLSFNKLYNSSSLYSLLGVLYKSKLISLIARSKCGFACSKFSNFVSSSIFFFLSINKFLYNSSFVSLSMLSFNNSSFFSLFILMIFLYNSKIYNIFNKISG